MMLVCFGYGYTAAWLAKRLNTAGGWRVHGTRTVPATAEGASLHVYRGDGPTADVSAIVAEATHVLISVPPLGSGCPVLRDFMDDLARATSLTWVGYLSTIGVYGDAGGAWVDEDTPPCPASERARRRCIAEDGWRAFGAATGTRVQVFRLPGIYGPSRSAIDALREGTARRIVKPGQVFNRIHVADIAGALHHAMTSAGPDGVFNITDDEPSPPQDVVAHAARLLGLPTPPDIPFATAELSEMGRSFYAESKRVRNTRMRTVLGYEPVYPTYREGLAAILAGA
jgi:nucleoside-diphosphate-sugar epimerase